MASVKQEGLKHLTGVKGKPKPLLIFFCSRNTIDVRISWRD